MQLQQLRSCFEASPALRLLRSSNAPFIVDFLAEQYKRANRLTVPHGELVATLAAYQERVHQAHPEALRDQPTAYLNQWSSAESRWLKRLVDATAEEPVYQLTPHTEEAISFLDQLIAKDASFVGTESRLRLVFRMLNDLVIGTTEDPVVRIAALERERAELDAQIAAIRVDNQGARYRPTRIREQFAEAVSIFKQLQRDFRAVEEKFKEITREVQRRQLEGGERRGGILEFALNAEDLLYEQDTGRSFREFVRFVLSPTQQEKLRELIHEVQCIEELTDQTDDLETLGQMAPLLMAEAEKVMRTNQRLSASLRRLLDPKASGDRRQIARLLGDIRALAVQCAERAPIKHVGIEVDAGLQVSAPLTRAFWSEPAQFEQIDLTEHAIDDDARLEAFRELAAMHRLDWQSMRDRIDHAIAQHGAVRLSQLLAANPPAGGIVEVLGYLQIANDDGHGIDQQVTEEIILPCGEGASRQLVITAPLVTFGACPEEIIGA